MNKHYIFYSALALALIFIGGAWLRSHDAWKDLQADLKLKEMQNQQAAQAISQAKASVQADTRANTQIDAATKAKLDGLQAQLASKPDSMQIQQMIQTAIPGVKVGEVKDAKGDQFLAVPDTQDNRDAINKVDADFKSCKFNLDGCQQKQANFQDIINRQTAIIALDEQIQTRQKTEMADLSKFGKGGNFWSRTGRVVIPVGCAALAGWAASQAKASSKAVAISAGGSGLACAFAIR